MLPVTLNTPSVQTIAMFETFDDATTPDPFSTSQMTLAGWATMETEYEAPLKSELAKLKLVAPAGTKRLGSPSVKRQPRSRQARDRSAGFKAAGRAAHRYARDRPARHGPAAIPNSAGLGRIGRLRCHRHRVGCAAPEWGCEVEAGGAGGYREVRLACRGQRQARARKSGDSSRPGRCWSCR